MERAMLDEKIRKELIEKHGPIAEIDDPTGRTLAARAPSGPAQLAFATKVAKENANKAQAILDLVRECSVYPEAEQERSSFIADNPLLAMSLGGSITEMATGGVEGRIRKN
jgi:hypothetical protein